MLAVLVLLNLLVIPLIIDGINIPLSKDTEDDICTFDDDLCRQGSDGGDNRTSGNGRRNAVAVALKRIDILPATSFNGSVLGQLN